MEERKVTNGAAKMDTASVLQEAHISINLLHEQIKPRSKRNKLWLPIHGFKPSIATINSNNDSNIQMQQIMLAYSWIQIFNCNHQSLMKKMTKYAKEGMRVEASKSEIYGTKHDAFVDMIASVFI